jgi:glycosyltransferase involved in cell wall biosynthesis
MRVLIVHNRYRAQGGEERSVAEIASLLVGDGHQVELLQRSSATLGRGRAAHAMLSGGLDPAEVQRAVTRFRADVVHAHNLHPLFGSRALAAAQSAGARTVLHLHNFRLFCAIGIAYRDGVPCYSCRGRDTRPGLRHMCRGSLPEAAVYALSLHQQQPSLFQHADALVALSDAHAARLRDLGTPSADMHVLPNFVADADWSQESHAAEGGYALASGRFAQEKGFDTAIAAARAADVPLVLAGAGPEESRLRALAAGADVRFTGWLSGDQLAGLRTRAAVVLVPSRWDEVCPYSVLDALATGVPTLVSDRGGLAEMVGAQTALPAGDVAAWTEALGRLWADPGLRRERGEEALARARERFGERRYLERLLAIYRGASVDE